MNTPKATEIMNLHRRYCDLTGMSISLDFGRERDYYEFLKRFTVADLETVVRYLRKQIARRERNQGALRFRNLIQNLDYFEEDLAMARADQRNHPRKDQRQAVVESFRPIVAEPAVAPVTAKTGHQVAIEALRKMKLQLFGKET